MSQDWKVAAAIAIHKGGSQSEAGDYGPLILVCILRSAKVHFKGARVSAPEALFNGVL